MNRREFLVPIVALALGACEGSAKDSPKGSPGVTELQARWRALLDPAADVATDPSPLRKSAADWRKELPPDSYAVLFEEETEPPFSSHLNLEKRPGVFACRACRLPLFTSEMKYDSGTGWPSFFTSIPGHLATKTDYRIVVPRTEYHCVRCGGHQGHVFDDGPAPSGERWCNNGLALVFIPLAG